MLSDCKKIFHDESLQLGIESDFLFVNCRRYNDSKHVQMQKRVWHMCRYTELRLGLL